MEQEEFEDDFSTILVEKDNGNVEWDVVRTKRGLRRGGGGSRSSSRSSSRSGGRSSSSGTGWGGSMRSSTGQTYYTTPYFSYGYYYNGVRYDYSNSENCHPDDADCISEGSR